MKHNSYQVPMLVVVAVVVPWAVVVEPLDLVCLNRIILIRG